MNLVAFLFVAIGLALGVAILVTTTIKNLVGWAVIAIAAGVILNSVFITWSHSVHN